MPCHNYTVNGLIYHFTTELSLCLQALNITFSWVLHSNFQVKGKVDYNCAPALLQKYYKNAATASNRCILVGEGYFEQIEVTKILEAVG